MNLSIDAQTGDLKVTKGQLVLVEKSEELEQHLGQRLRTFLGEWFLDITLGLPYYDEILKKQVNANVVDSIFIDEILATPGVVRLLSFNSDLTLASRGLTIDFIAESVDGIIDFKTEVS